MLYNLLTPLSEQFIAANLFRYLTFRAGAACITALVISLMFGPALIRTLRAIQRQDAETAEKVTRQHVSGALTLRLRIMRAGT